MKNEEEEALSRAKDAIDDAQQIAIDCHEFIGFIMDGTPNASYDEAFQAWVFTYFGAIRGKMRRMEERIKKLEE